MSAWRTRLRWGLAVLGGLLLIVVAAGIWAWWQMRGSLAQLDGAQPVAGLAAAVKVERDGLGVPTITGANRTDVARALGFLHAQDRYFQMDLLRRRGAGELSELFGRAALELDREARLHGFRRIAGQVVATATPAERTVLAAYTAGVNAGLASLDRVPWEYLVIRTKPQPWREEDTLLCFYAMWFDLQDYHGNYERNRDAIREALGQPAMDFLAPRGNSWDAALDGSTFAVPPLPSLRFKKAGKRPGGVAAIATPEKRVVGSNAFAVAGTHTATGAGMLANDMHLDHNLPQIWYRAVMQWTDAGGAHRLVGVTLPGTPFITVGSNGHVAWGFTDAYVDTTDVITVAVEPRANSFYQTPDGWKEIEDRAETIQVKGSEAVPFTARWTRWGPFIEEPKNGAGLVLRWTAHDAGSTNLHFMDIEQAQTVADVVAVAHRAGIPNENCLAADSTGNVAWTVIGQVPRRVGYDGRVPVSWGYGDRRWDGYLPAEEIPVVTTQPGKPADQLAKDGVLWSGNNRALGDEPYRRLGDSGYDDGARGGQIRDGLRVLVATGKKAVPADLLAIQLDERALFLDRWQKFLLEVLTDEAVAAKKGRAELRETVRAWNGHASTDSAAYRLVRAFRLRAAELALGPFAEAAQQEYPAFSWRNFPYEDAVWRLAHEQPADLLNPKYASWSALLLAAADDIETAAVKEGPLANYTWGKRNQLAMRHPFSQFLPGVLARRLDMPAVALPGDNDMPRVAGPRFGQSERLVVSPGHEEEAIFHMPGGQSGHPLSPFYRAGHDAWVKGEATPLLPGPTQHTLTLTPQ
jgi:penicillin amidase